MAKVTVHPQNLACLKAQVEATTGALSEKLQVTSKRRQLNHLLSRVSLAHFLAFVPPVSICKADTAQLPCYSGPRAAQKTASH